MQVTNTLIKAERAEGIEISYAPSLSAAVRADAELLVKLCIGNGLTSSEDALSKHLRGDVSADVEGFGNEWFVSFYYNGSSKVFAIVEVIA